MMTWLSIGALSLVDLVALAAMATGWAGRGGAIAHGLATFLAIVVVAVRARHRRPPYVLSMVGASAFGPVAMLIAFAVARARVEAMRAGGATPARMSHLTLMPPRGSGRRLVDRIAEDQVALPTSAMLGSLHDMLRYGDIAGRQSAIATVVTNFEPRLSSIIARALTDPEQSVRAQAAAAATEITASLHKTRKAMAQGDDPRSFAAYLVEQGRHNVLLSDGMRRQLLEQAASLLRPLADDGTSAQVHYAAVLSDLGRGADARRMLEPHVDWDTGAEAVLLLYIETLYRDGRYDMLDAVAGRLLNRPAHLDDRLRDVARFWNATPEPRAA